jgi:hypothetical protein
MANMKSQMPKVPVITVCLDLLRELHSRPAPASVEWECSLHLTVPGKVTELEDLSPWPASCSLGGALVPPPLLLPLA